MKTTLIAFTLMLVVIVSAAVAGDRDATGIGSANGPGHNGKGALSLPNPPRANIAAGRAVFLQACSPCHGTDGGGDEGPSLKNLGLSVTFISGMVSKGVKGQMPSFGNSLGKTGVRNVAAYVSERISAAKRS